LIIRKEEMNVMNKENDIFFFHRYNYISIDQIKEIVRLIEVFNHFS